MPTCCSFFILVIIWVTFNFRTIWYCIPIICSCIPCYINWFYYWMSIFYFYCYTVFLLYIIFTCRSTWVFMVISITFKCTQCWIRPSWSWYIFNFYIYNYRRSMFWCWSWITWYILSIICTFYWIPVASFNTCISTFFFIIFPIFCFW